MHTIKIDVSDTLYEKVMNFLKQLPKNEVKMEEVSETSSDFIEHLTKNPVKLSKNVTFLARDEAHER